MKPAAFDYAVPATLAEAVALLAQHGGEAKAARDSFADMPQADRDALIAFVNAL